MTYAVLANSCEDGTLLSMWILLVEDHEDCIKGTTETLRHEQHSISVARSAFEARRICGTLEFDLLLVDIGLPGENGWDFYDAFRRTGKTPAIALSGLSDPRSIQRSLDTGFAAHLVKPIDQRELLAAIQTVCGLER